MDRLVFNGKMKLMVETDFLFLKNIRKLVKNFNMKKFPPKLLICPSYFIIAEACNQ